MVRVGPARILKNIRCALASVRVARTCSYYYTYVDAVVRTAFFFARPAENSVYSAQKPRKDKYYAIFFPPSNRPGRGAKTMNTLLPLLFTRTHYTAYV
jgi:hypothetical protein